MTEGKNLILGHMIAGWLDKDPERRVLTFVSIDRDGAFHDETRTYQEIWGNAQRLAQALLDEGMEEHDRFAIMMQNHPEFVDAMVASSIANTVYVPIDPRVQGRKLRYMLDHAECKGVIAADYVLPQLSEVVSELPQLKWVWVVRTRPASASELDGRCAVRDVADILDDSEPNLPLRAQDPADPMQMLYTSGTTGDPKAILAPYQRFGGIATLGEALGIREDDRPYTGLSMTHANAQLITVGNALRMGTEAVIGRKFTKSRLWDITREYGCTMFNLLGGMTTAIFSEPQRDDDADNPVRYVLSAGMPAKIWDAFRERFGVEIFEFYGTAEGGVTVNPPGEGPIGSMGKPPASLIAKIFDEEDRECPPGEPGELVFRNADGGCPQVQYYKNEEASKKKMRGGWLRTGDICSMDENGWFYFHHRKGDEIRHNGEFVEPSFVEKEIGEMDAIDDVFVYGIPAASGAPGEKDIVAAVVPRDTDRYDPEEVLKHCSENLESSHVPTYIQMMSEIPKTASEKPMQRYCVEAFENEPESVFPKPSVAGQRKRAL